MNVKISTDEILKIIQSGAVATESRALIDRHVSVIALAQIEGGVINEVEAARILEIYERRKDLLQLQGKITFGFDEVFTSLRCFSEAVRPVIAETDKYKIIFFLDNKMKFLIGAGFIENEP